MKKVILLLALVAVAVGVGVYYFGGFRPLRPEEVIEKNLRGLSDIKTVEFSPAPAYRLEPSSWTGYIQYGSMTHHFTLVISEVVPNPASNGSRVAFRGYIDWGPHGRLKIEGTAEGNHLQFVETAFLIGSAEGGLGNRWDVHITGDQMAGTVKNGMALVHAQRSVGSIPQEVNPIQRGLTR